MVTGNLTRGRIGTLDYTDYISRVFSPCVYDTAKGLLDYKATVIYSYLNFRYKQH